MNFAKLSNDELQDLLASKAVYAAEIERRYGVFNKLKSIFSVVCDFFNRGVDPFTAPLALEYGVPHHSVRKSRFSGVARAKREAKKRRNRRG